MEPMVATRANVTTWADGFGIWHVRVSRTAAAPLIAARRALRDELLARQPLCPRYFWMHPVLVVDQCDDATLVYKEADMPGPSDEKLDCGHPPTPQDIDSLATGVARAAEADYTMCYSCAEKLEREALAAQRYPMQTAFSAYLSKGEFERFNFDDSKRLPYIATRFVSTWSGGRLLVVTDYNETQAGFGGVSTGKGRIYFRALDAQGREWFGNSPGWGMFCRLRLLKPKES